MKKFLLAACLALPLLALGQQAAWADNCCTPLYRIGLSIGIVYRGWCGCDYGTCTVRKGWLGCKQYFNSCPAPESQPAACCGIGGPWYGVWPHTAHFQVPAPTGFPYWSAPMTYGSYGVGHAAAPLPQPGSITQTISAPPEMGYYGHGLAVMPASGNFGGFAPQGANVQAGYYQAPSYWYGR